MKDIAPIREASPLQRLRASRRRLTRFIAALVLIDMALAFAWLLASGRLLRAWQ
jgi:hypothetical protein